MKKIIYILEQNKKLTQHITMQKIGYEVRSCNTPLRELSNASLIAIHEDSLNFLEEVMRIIANNNMPIIVFSHKYNTECMKKCTEVGVIYCCEYLDILTNTILSILKLYNNAKTSNPLTGLPGNSSIEKELQARLNSEKDFAVLYVDLDNFKPYNDKYGFLKGDTLIMYTAEIIRKSIRSNDFIGHIGGDDFIVILEGNAYASVCKRIINNFDNGIGAFFEKEVLDKGTYESIDRKGVYKSIPITTISIGVVPINVLNRILYSNIGTIAEAGTLMKKEAKKHSISYFSVKD